MCLVDEAKSGAILWDYFIPLALKMMMELVFFRSLNKLWTFANESP
jgi:hypothetical protein